jgi:hypothetical protein
MQRHRFHLARCAAAAALASLALGALAQSHPANTRFDPATGTLTVGDGAPGGKNIKIEMKQGPGVAVVLDAAAAAPRTFTGVRRIAMDTGAGSDQIEFDLDVAQSLALDIMSGSGDANVKIQWKLRPTAGAVQSTLAMRSGGGIVNTELDFESEAADSTFDWTANFGGGNKLVKAGVEFKPGTQVARNRVALALGGGRHVVGFEGDSAARDASFSFDAGNATEVLYKLLSPNPTQRLDVATTVRGEKNGVEILAAASDLRTRLSGSAASGTGVAETNWNVAQTVAGTITATSDFRGAGTAMNFGAKFDGAASTLTLGGLLVGTVGNDSIKVETSANVISTLLLDALGGDNVLDFIAVGRLVAGAVQPRFVMGGGNDNFNLIARDGSTANPAIDCGAGADNAKASVGTPSGCENFTR